MINQLFSELLCFKEISDSAVSTIPLTGKQCNIYCPSVIVLGKEMTDVISMMVRTINLFIK